MGILNSLLTEHFKQYIPSPIFTPHVKTRHKNFPNNTLHINVAD